MAAPASDDNPSSSQQDSSSTSIPRSKVVQDAAAWAAAHRYDPPHREKIERQPGEVRRGHGGPIWVTEQDGVFIGTSKKEYDRLAQLRAAGAGAGTDTTGATETTDAGDVGTTDAGDAAIVNQKKRERETGSS